MKRLTLPDITTEVVVAKQLPDSKYYGVEFNHPSHRAFITKKDFFHGTYTVRAVNGLTDGNSYSLCEDEYTNLDKFVQTLIGRGKQVFMFDCFDELADWLVYRK